MKEILFCGLDVDDKAFHAHLVSERGEEFSFSCRPNSGVLIKKLKEFEDKGFQVKACYEATYLGYSLHRDLAAQQIDCDLIAPSLIPQTPGDRIKTDRLDSEKLALYLMKGILTPVHIPSFDDEVDRNFVRSRNFVASQLKGLRNYILSSCRKMGLDFKQETGSDTLDPTTPDLA